MKFLYFLAFAIIGLSASAQVNGAYLNQNQKEVIYNTYKDSKVKAMFSSSYRKDTLSGFSIDLFNEKGRPTHEFRYRSDSSLRSLTINFYNDLDHPIGENEFIEGELERCIYQYYNFQGQEIERVQKKPNGALQSRSVSQYTKEGLKEKNITYSSTGIRIFVDFIQSYGNYPSTVEMKHKSSGRVLIYSDSYYNDAGLITKKESKFGSAKIETVNVFKYDENDLLIRQFAKKESKILSHTAYQYFTEDSLAVLENLGFDFATQNFDSKIQKPTEWVLRPKAQFLGGTNAILDYLEKDTKYLEKANKMDVHGIVMVKFNVDENGEIKKVKVEKSLHSKLDRGAKKLIKKMPNWIPAKDVNGNSIASEVILPVHF